MRDTTALKASVLAVLTTVVHDVTGLDDADVRSSRSVRAPFRRIGRKAGIFLVYGGWTASASERQYAAAPKKRKGRDTWHVIVMAESYRSADDGFEKDGGANALFDAVFGLEGVDVQPSGWARGPLLLAAETGNLTEPDEGITEQGGTVGYVITFTSSEYLL